MEEKICPYPGLRPFTDDEAIFFRGRERNIDTIVELFEKKKFMMLTGASGDGKSSLVYAGVVPQARAGLFKAKYNNWAIADFRPERAPLDNFTTSLNKHFKFDSDETLKKELSYGFSSLINIYKNSPLYLNTESNEWREADDAKKKQIKRKASNLLIIADQFEEFFTNTENYNNGIASVESQTVINLLLETAKTALAEDLPIYIICTMRSDYIGQCAAFRGLPEYIGFSQFFVPRLKRNEIQQVIEEPAQLNGDKISNRLSQRLLNDITEGYDQLPILQHALNQIWKIADKGNEEMDLIHYAKVGGLHVNQLPEEEQKQFNLWITKKFLKDSSNKINSDEVKDEKSKTSLLLQLLPDFQKKFFTNPSLENVLNAHADELFETAFDKCVKKHPEIEQKINKETSQQIIKTTFQCLTKIDEARAVRNRMTLQEINDIIHNPEIDVDVVGKVLDIFREQGNTFIKPFITEEKETLKTHNETVLDITHESLIRNWDILKIWAKEEYDNWLNFEDFNKQLQRWINSGKQKGYLLPIGPFTFFDNWYKTCKPNKYWLARYDESDDTFNEKLNKAEETLKNAEEFIKRSGRKLIFSRTVLKYGAKRLLVVLGLVALVCSCSYYYFDFREKQNDTVLTQLEKEGLEMLTTKKLSDVSKAEFLIIYDRLHPKTFRQLLDSLHNDNTAFDIAREMFGKVQNFEEHEKENADYNPLINPLLNYMSEKVDSIYSKQISQFHSTKKFRLERINSMLGMLAFVRSYDNQKGSRSLKASVEKLYKIHELLLNNPVDSVKIDVEEFNSSIQLLLALAPQTKFDFYINKLSPLENNIESKKRFNTLYENMENNETDEWNKPASLGGYQLLTCLYATQPLAADNSKFLNCLDSLYKYNPTYSKYVFQNFYEIIATLNKYKNFPFAGCEDMIQNYVAKYNLDYQKTIEEIAGINFYKHIEYWQAKENISFLNYYERFFCTSEQRNKIWGFYEKSLDEYYSKGLKIKYTNGKSQQTTTINAKFTNDEFNYNMAMYYKMRGCYVQEMENNSSRAHTYFYKAFEYFDVISKEFLDTRINYNTYENLSRRFVFLYPKMLNSNAILTIQHKDNSFSMTNTMDPYSFNPADSKSLEFFNIISSKNFYKYYNNKEGILLLNKFLNYSLINNKQKKTEYYKCLSVLDILLQTVPDLKTEKETNKVLLANKAFDENDTLEAKKIISKLDFKTEDLRGYNKLAQNLAKNNYLKESFQVINSITDIERKRNLLVEIAYALQEKGPVENSFLYLDSLFKNNDLDGKPQFDNKLIKVLGMIGSKPMFELAVELTKDISEDKKPEALTNLIEGITYNGYYYKALTYIPDYMSTENEFHLHNIILQAEARARSKEKAKRTGINSGWESFDGKED